MTETAPLVARADDVDGASRRPGRPPGARRLSTFGAGGRWLEVHDGRARIGSSSFGRCTAVHVTRRRHPPPVSAPARAIA